MSNYTLSGSIILEDHFSQSLEQLEAGAKGSTSAVDRLGTALDGLGEAPGVRAMQRELGQLSEQAAQAQADLGRMSQGLQNIPGAERVKELETRIAQLQARAKAGVKLSVAELDEFQALNGELNRLQSNLDAVSGKSGKARGAISMLTQGLGAFGIAFGAQQLISGAVAITQLGARAVDTEKAFRNLAAAQGVNADRLLAEMQRASQGTISQLDLMTQANRALLSLGKEGAEALPQLLEGARASAMATGESVEFMFQSLVQGIAKASPEILDNLGIVIRIEEANKAYADSIGKTVDALSAQERSTALLRATMGQLADYQDKVGLGEGKSEAEKVKSLEIAWKELTIALGEYAVQLGVVQGLEAATNFIKPKEAEELKDEILLLVGSLRDVGRQEDAIKLLQGLNQAKNELGNDLPALTNALDELLTKFNLIATSGIAARSGISAVVEVQKIMASVAATDTGNLPYWAGQLNAAGGAAGSAVGPFLSLEAAILRVVGATKAWATTPDIASGLEAAIGNTESKFLSLAGVLDTDAILQKRDAWVKILENTYRNAGNMTEYEWKIINAKIAAAQDDEIAIIKKSHEQIEVMQEQHVKRLFDSAGGLKSAIEAALSTGLEVTDIDMQLSASGQYEDKVKESARQLNAIAERGFSELSVHPDWAGALGIPPEVLSGNEAMLKAWAAQTSQDVQNNLRPDLINWDAFVQNFQAGLEAEAAKGLTIDIAVEKLQAAGVLDQDTQAIRDEIAEKLGLKAPTMTIDALFATNEGAAAQLVNDLTEGKGYVDIPANVVASGELAIAGISPTPGTAAASVEALTPTVDSAAAASAGDTAATAMTNAFTGTAVGVDVGVIILAGWTASIQAQRTGFAAIGADVGHEVATAMREAAKSDLGGFRNDMVSILLPPIVRALARQNGGSGAVD